MRFFNHVVLLFLFGTGVIFSQENVYVLDTLYPVHSLDHYLKVYPDSSNSLSPEKLLADNSQPFLRGDRLPRFLEVVTNYWGYSKMVGVEYAVPLALSPDGPPEGFIGDGDQWDKNYNLPGGAWTLHAWVVIENPDGVFTDLNPSVPMEDPSKG